MHACRGKTRACLVAARNPALRSPGAAMKSTMPSSWLLFARGAAASCDQVCHDSLDSLYIGLRTRPFRALRVWVVVYRLPQPRPVVRARSMSFFASLMEQAKGALAGDEGVNNREYAVGLLKGLQSDELKAQVRPSSVPVVAFARRILRANLTGRPMQRYSAKEFSYMCGDDNRHLGMVQGVLDGNRKAVVECGGLDELVSLVEGEATRPICSRAAADCTSCPRYWGCASRCPGGETKDSALQEQVLSSIAGLLHYKPAVQLVHTPF
jgi:hypothetical protein